MKADKVKTEEMIGKLLTSRGQSIALAESCSGGMLSDLVTNIPGASSYFRGGVIAYSNEAKEKLLAVPHALLCEFGAVSEQVAEKMAAGVRALFDADIGVGITGIAGPGGATRAKPAGLVYVALSVRKNAFVHKFNFSGKRIDIKKGAASAALDLLGKYLMSKGPLKIQGKAQ